jgi:hypothetical protein
MHEGKMYEVVFIGNDPDRISRLSLRRQNGLIVEVRYGEWSSGRYYSPRDLNPKVVAAARRARSLNPAQAKAQEKENAIRQLYDRRSECLEKIKKIDVIIKQMQRGGLPASRVDTVLHKLLDEKQHESGPPVA